MWSRSITPQYIQRQSLGNTNGQKSGEKNGQVEDCMSVRVIEQFVQQFARKDVPGEL